MWLYLFTFATMAPVGKSRTDTGLRMNKRRSGPRNAPVSSRLSMPMGIELQRRIRQRSAENKALRERQTMESELPPMEPDVEDLGGSSGPTDDQDEVTSASEVSGN
jgi:hypothetical protein